MNFTINDLNNTEINGALFNAVLDVQFDETGSTEPVTVAECKSFAKIDTTADDTLIAELAVTAREMCEAYTNISFVQREVTAILNNSLGGIYLPYGPVLGDVTSVKDEDGNDVTDPQIKGSNFKFIKYPALEYLEVVYDAGYEELPSPLKTAVLNQFAHLYDNRGNGANDMAAVSKQLLKPFRRVS